MKNILKTLALLVVPSLALAGVHIQQGDTNVSLGYLQVSSITCSGSPCGSGGGTGPSGQIVASPQFQVPYYSSSGSTNTISGTSLITLGTSQVIITTMSVSSITVTGNLTAGSLAAGVGEITAGSSLQSQELLLRNSSNDAALTVQNVGASGKEQMEVFSPDGTAINTTPVQGVDLTLPQLVASTATVSSMTVTNENFNGGFATLNIQPAASSFVNSQINFSANSTPLNIGEPSNAVVEIVGPNSTINSINGISKPLLFVSGNLLVTSTAAVKGAGGLSVTYGVTAGSGTFSSALTVAGQNVCQANGTNCPAGGGVTVYPATATASFPFGLSASSIAVSGAGPGQVVLTITGSTNTVIASSAASVVGSYLVYTSTNYQVGTSTGTGGSGGGGSIGGSGTPGQAAYFTGGTTLGSSNNFQFNGTSVTVVSSAIFTSNGSTFGNHPFVGIFGSNSAGDLLEIGGTATSPMLEVPFNAPVVMQESGAHIGNLQIGGRSDGDNVGDPQSLSEVPNTGGGSQGISAYDANGNLDIGTAAPGVGGKNGSINLTIGDNTFGSGGTNEVVISSAGVTISTAATFSSSVTVKGALAISSSVVVAGSAGTNGQVLTSAGPGIVPSWATISGGGGSTGGSIIASTQGNISYYSSVATNTLNGSSNFTFNTTTVTVNEALYVSTTNATFSFPPLGGFSSTPMFNQPVGNASYGFSGQFSTLLYLMNTNNYLYSNGSYMSLATGGSQVFNLYPSYLQLYGSTLSNSALAIQAPIANVYSMYLSTTSAGGNSIAVSTNSELVVNGSTGTNGQVLTSQGPGLPIHWTTVSGGGGVGSSTTTVQINGVILSTGATNFNFVNANGTVVKASTPTANSVNIMVASDISELTFVSTGTNLLNIGGNCTSALPCNLRQGNTVWSFTSTATATLVSGSGTAYVYLTPSGAVTVGYPSAGMSVTCGSGCTATSGVTSFPVNALPLYTWVGTSGAWATTGTDERPYLSMDGLTANTGIVVTPGQTTGVGIDNTIVAELSGNQTFTGPIAFSGNVTLSSGIILSNGAGTTGQVFTSSGTGFPGYWATGSGGGGSGIVSAGTFTWVNNFGMQVSTMAMINSTSANTLTISTSATGIAQVAVSSVIATAPSDFLLNISSSSGTMAFGVQNQSNVISSGTAPSVSSCGTGSPSVNGTNMQGTITTGTGSPTACTLTFSNGGYANTPTCVCSPNAGVSCGVTSASKTAVTFTLSVTETGINYICIGNKG